MSRTAPVSLMTVITTFVVSASSAVFAEDYQLNGNINLSSGYYDNVGDPASRFYASEGVQSFGSANVNFSQRVSYYEDIRSNLSLLANDSDYRDNNTGLEIDSAQIRWTKGDTTLPLRLIGGDYLAYVSQRTLQTSLIGAQLEIQPELLDRLGSLQLFSGLANSDYRQLENNDTYSGLSWLSSLNDETAYSVNLVHNRQTPLQQQALNQFVSSVAIESQLQIRDYRVTAEAELAYFRGDLNNSGNITKQTDQGIFTQLNARSLDNTSYQLKYERYGKYYRPAGASVTSNRESLEAHISRQLASGLRLQGRAQQFKSGLEDVDTLTNRIIGLGAGGSLSLYQQQLGYQLDAFVNNADNRSNSIDTVSTNVRTSLSTSLADGVRGQLYLYHTNTENQITDNAQTTRQGGFSLSSDFQQFGWQGRLSPALGFTEVSGNNADNRQINSSLNFSASRYNHSVLLNLRSLQHHFDASNAVDTETGFWSAKYSFSQRKHKVSLEYVSQYREPKASTKSSGYFVGLDYQYSFDLDKQRFRRVSTPLATHQTAFSPIAIGASQRDALAIANRLGTSSSLQGEYLFTHGVFLDAIDVQQQLISHSFAGNIDAVALILKPDQGLPLDQLLNEALAYVSDTLGAPDKSIEKGRLTNVDNLDLAMGSTRYLYSWRYNDNTYLLGVQTGLADTPYIELNINQTTQLPDATDNWGFWSISP